MQVKILIFYLFIYFTKDVIGHNDCALKYGESSKILFNKFVLHQSNLKANELANE